MPEKSVDISGLSVGVGVVLAVVSSYAIFVIKTLFAKIESVQTEIKKDLEHQHTAILDIYSTLNKSAQEIARIEERIEALKQACEKNHRG